MIEAGDGEPLITGRSPWRPEPFEVAVERRLRSLEDWRLEMRTVWRIVQLTFGTSLLAAIVGIANLIALWHRP